jgi:hypothetical protein
MRIGALVYLRSSFLSSKPDDGPPRLLLLPAVALFMFALSLKDLLGWAPPLNPLVFPIALRKKVLEMGFPP